MKGVLKDSRKWWDGGSEVRGVLGRDKTVGQLIERVVKRFAGTCIARRDIVNPSIQAGLAKWVWCVKRDRYLSYSVDSRVVECVLGVQSPLCQSLRHHPILKALAFLPGR